MRIPRPFRIDAVLFDFDGTLTKPGAIDFDAIKEALGSDRSGFALEHVVKLEGAERERADAILRRFEIEGADRSEPNDGAERIIEVLRGMGVPLGIVTRNTLPMIEHAIRRFDGVTLDDFDVVVTRDLPLPFKPAPDTILHAATELGVAPERCAMVGDFIVDVQAGRAAGAVTVHLVDPADDDPPDHEADFRIDDLRDLETIVRLGQPLPTGKVPNDLLAGSLAQIDAAEGLLIAPGIGEDVAAVDLVGAEILVAHADPITLSAERLGPWAVLVNANDIATSGGEPRWFLATVLVPPGTTASEALSLLEDVGDACDHAHIALVGGHTEVTDAVTRPVVAGTMLGTVAGEDLREKSSISTDDLVVMTQRLAIEGTALLAQERGAHLRSLGMTDEELARATSFIERLSVSPAARVARRFPGVRAMHDVTEGGLATAVRELAVAAGHSVTVDRDAVPTYPETARICELLRADPLGLIGSGTLLIVCAPQQATALVDALAGAGIEASVIGAVGERGGEVTATSGGRPAPWPAFDVDEAARLLG